MDLSALHPASAWNVDSLERDASWRLTIEPAAAAAVARSVRAALDPDKRWFDYTVDDVDLEPIWPVLERAVSVAHHGCGLALVHGLPRDGLSAAEFELLSWALGLRIGVARPQGKATQYLSAVRDAGTDYRSASGRGYSSSSKLDFHVDGADLATLSCYNQAVRGGESMIASGVSAWQALEAEAPELADVVCQPFSYSRQNEQAPDESPHYQQPIYDSADGRLFVKWNRNRIQSAQRFAEVARFTPRQIAAMAALDEIIRRPGLMYRMYLRPGDLQVFNNHTILHSRTEFEDAEDPASKRLLFRLWLAPPDSPRLPDSWGQFFGDTRPGTVRGGIRGHHHDAACVAFERRQAGVHGMRCETVATAPA